MLKRKPWLFIVSLVLMLTVGALTHRYWLASLLRPLPVSSKVLGPPKGLITVAEAAQHQGVRLITNIQPAESECIQSFPLFASTQPSEESVIPHTSLLVLPEARIWGTTGVVITNDDLVISETTLDWAKKPAQHSIFRRSKLATLHKTRDSIAVIASKGHYCYYHWMFDILPRLETLRLSQLPYDKIYINSLEKPYQNETLKILQIDPQKIIGGNGKQHIQARQVLLPSLPSHLGHLSRWSCEFLRKTFLPADKVFKQEERIFISRRDASYRKISNEDQVVDLLQKYGFKLVLAEKLTVSEQAELFASSAIVIAQHGASLTNLVFCQPHTQVIEFFSSNWLNDCYWRLSHNVQLQHHCMLSPLTHPESKSIDKFDITVDCVQLQQLLDQIINIACTTPQACPSEDLETSEL